MEESKHVHVNILDIVNLPISELNDFQDDIKHLSEESYEKLKAEILEDGFSFSPHVFSDSDGVYWILDGHQRKACLVRMEQEGYIIPSIPCVEIAAESLDHARSLVLAGASTYGDFRNDKLESFIKNYKISPKKIDITYKLANFDINKTEQFTGVNAHNRKIPDGAKELDSDDFNSFDHKCPKCGFEFNE